MIRRCGLWVVGCIYKWIGVARFGRGLKSLSGDGNVELCRGIWKVASAGCDFLVSFCSRVRGTASLCPFFYTMLHV